VRQGGREGGREGGKGRLKTCLLLRFGGTDRGGRGGERGGTRAGLFSSNSNIRRNISV